MAKTDINSITNEALRELQARGSITYLSAYVVLMSRSLEVPISKERIDEMIPKMVEPLDHATQTMWQAMMKDGIGALGALDRFKESLDKLTEE